MNKTCSLMLPALCTLAASAASAQTVAPPDPLDPRARVPLVEYSSPLSSYQRYRDPSLADWRETNEQVGSLGGHAGHTQGQANPVKPARSPTPEASQFRKPAAHSHGGHR